MPSLSSSHKRLLLAFGVLPSSILALLSAPVSAEVDYFDLTLEQLLQTTIISANKKIETVADTTSATYVVSNEDILRSGVTTIPDVLRMVPGVNVAQSDSNSWAVSIRGFNSVLANKLLVLIDGRSIYNPVFGGVLWEAQDLMLEDVDRIEVVRGPGGTVWGANAVNGVINIITKKAEATQGSLVSALYGNEERGTLNARHGASFAENGFYRVYVKGFKRDSSLTTANEDNYDEWEGIRTGFRADVNEHFTVQGDAYRNDTLQRRAVPSLTAPYASIENQTIRYEGVNVLARWSDVQSDGSQISVQSYIDYAQRDEPFNFIDERMTYDLEAQYNFAQLSIHEITIGAGYRLLQDDKTGNVNVSFSPQSRNDNIYNAFFQDEITLVPREWFLTLGAKLEHNAFSGFEPQPNIRLQWSPDQQQTFWAAISRAVRTPTPIEADMTSTIATAPGIKVAFSPNNDFKAEKLTAYELGYRHQITPNFSTDFSVFYNDYSYLSTTRIDPFFLVDNGIDPIHLFVPVKFTNDMSGTSDGFEAAVNWSINSNLKTAFSYSYLNMALTALDPTQEGAELISPEHQLGTKIFWNITEKITLDTLLLYTDEIPAFNVDSYVRLDINIGGEINKNLRLNLVGQNLLDDSHREFGASSDLNVGEIERSIFAKLTWTFN